MKLPALPIVLLVLAACVGPASTHAESQTSAEELEQAIRLYRTEGAEIALPEFERLYAAFVADPDRVHRVQAERYIGESHWRLGNYDQARRHLDNALAGFRGLGEKLGEGKVLNVLGLLEWDLGNYEQAITDFQQASAIGSELGDRRLAGSTMNNLSLVYDELGDYQTSLRQYHQALDLYEGADFPRGESDTLGNIGGTYLLLGRYQEALSYYERALRISEALASKSSMSLDHGNLALCYLGLGQVDRSIRHFDLAIGFAIDTGMRKEEALWLRGKGNVLIRQGRYDLGLENHRAALAIYEQVGARGLLLDALHDMGQLHLLLGDFVSAEQYFERGAGMARELGLAQAVTANLLALGDLQSKRDHREEANALYEQALHRATDAGELNYQAESLLGLSLNHRGLGQLDRAEKEARRALAIAEDTEASPAAAEAWFALGELHRLQGQVETALRAYDHSQAAMGQGMDPDLRWQLHFGRAQALIERGDGLSAVTELEVAVGIIESVRQRLREERFRAGYVQDKYKVYVTLVRLQLELGLIQHAFSTAERLRARSFIDQLVNQGPVPRNQKDSRMEFVLQERIRQLQNALDEENSMPAPERRQMAVDTFSSELLVAEREYQAFLDDMKGRTSLDRADRIPTLQEVQSVLEPGAVLIEYVVGDDGVMILAVRAGALSAVYGEVRIANLTAKVNLVRELIQQPSSDSWWEPAASLSDSLIAPLQEQSLLEDVSHLYLVPHGILNYLPFAVLPTDRTEDRPVIMEQFTLSYLPAAATLVGSDSDQHGSPSLLALAPERSRLRHSLEEAQSIARLYQPNSRLLSGVKATESIFKEQAQNYGILHLSTHGYFNPNNPLLSGLELEADDINDGMLQVHEILGLSLNAGLVTLSACETAMGSGYFNTIPAGDEFVSLTRAFLVAGSRSVLATLWEVDDRSTVELMEGFYDRLGRGKNMNHKAAALAQVQRALKKSGRHKHPFYWAPFVLVGQHEQAGDSRG